MCLFSLIHTQEIYCNEKKQQEVSRSWFRLINYSLMRDDKAELAHTKLIYDLDYLHRI